MPVELQERCCARLSARLHNLYGPTETTIDATCWSCTPEPEQGQVPIGRPIANTQLYLLGTHAQPVPVGIAGEVYIGGAGLARGYCHCPALTAEKFLPHPFSREPGARLYKTGELGRYRSDGNIEFLGRLDHQVKLRGLRIELEEIAAALVQHPGVAEAVVVPRADVGHDGQLVAYLTLSGTQSPGTSTLRAGLAATLPAYVVLPALPLAPHGKIDRQALPAPDRVRAELEAAFVAPRTPTARQVARIWAELLNMAQVGVYDDFFALGGHSLLTVQLLARLRAMLQVDMPLHRLFQTPTVAGIAEVIDGRGSATDAAAIAAMAGPDLIAEAQLDPAIVPGARAPQRRSARAAILLTGATGFVGAYLLGALLT